MAPAHACHARCLLCAAAHTVVAVSGRVLFELVVCLFGCLLRLQSIPQVFFAVSWILLWKLPGEKGNRPASRRWRLLVQREQNLLALANSTPCLASPHSSIINACELYVFQLFYRCCSAAFTVEHWYVWLTCGGF